MRIKYDDAYYKKIDMGDPTIQAALNETIDSTDLTSYIAKEKPTKNIKIINFKDYSALSGKLRKIKVDTIIHCASQNWCWGSWIKCFKRFEGINKKKSMRLTNWNLW